MVSEKRQVHQVNLSWPKQPPYYVLFCGNCETFLDIVPHSKVVAGYLRWCRTCGHETVYYTGSPENRSMKATTSSG